MREREGEEKNKRKVCAMVSFKKKKLTILGLVEEEAKDDGLGAHGRV